MDVAVPAGRLGDWYANAFSIGRTQLILCVSERTLLPVILPAREFRTLPQRLMPAVEWMLKGLGAPDSAVADEIALMEGMPFGRTRSRAVLGSMSEMIFEAQIYLDSLGRNLDVRAASIHLCTSICGQLDYATPGEATVRAFGTPSPR